MNKTALFFSLLGIVFFAGACARVTGPGLHFRQTTVVGTEHDTTTKATKVSISFEVWDNDVQLKQLSRESFTVYEDGYPATSESLNQADTQTRRLPVVLLLDTSLSMYQANAVATLKSAADRFIQTLNSNGFDVTVIKFATEVTEVPGIAQIPDTFDDASGDRWTSLYAAVMTGLRIKGNGILVVFSDGADNYSQNHGVTGLGSIEPLVRPIFLQGTGDMRVIHAIGFGNVATEKDRNGLSALSALESMSQNGSFNYADQPGALDRIFQDVAARIRDVYVFEYYSPNLSGVHRLSVEARANGMTAMSPSMEFSGGGTLPGADSGMVPATQEEMVAFMAAQGTLDAGAESVDEASRLFDEILTGPPANRGTLLKSLCDGEKVQRVRAFTDALVQMDQMLPTEAKEQAKLIAVFRDEMELLCEKREKYGLAGFNFDPTGLIGLVQEGSGAEAAGLKVNDKIVSVDGKPFTEFANVNEVAGAVKGDAGTVVTIVVSRNGKKREFKVTRRTIVGAK